MQVIEITKYGGPEVLQPATRQIPELDNDEILIKTASCGVNRPDLLQRQGKYPPPEGASDIPGLEISGTVVKSKSALFKEGDEVCALLTGGGYAEYAVCPTGQALHVPRNIPLIDAAGLPETLFTVWKNIFHLGAFKKGEIVLIHGGASGIGVSAIQMVKAMGGHVFITAGDEQKCNACVALGADKAVNYKKEDFLSALGEESADIVLDMVGGDYVAKNLKILKPKGRHISIAFLNGIKAEINIATIMHKELSLKGSTLRAKSSEEKEVIRNALEEHIWPFLRSGDIKPVIDKKFKLQDAKKAHAYLEKGEHVGKILLIP